MVTPNDELDQFMKDPRTPCKYGEECYQQNPQHLQKYKHPPKKTKVKKTYCNSPKRQKLNGNDHSKEKANAQPCKLEDKGKNDSKCEKEVLNCMSDSDGETSTDISVLDNNTNESDSFAKASTSTNTVSNSNTSHSFLTENSTEKKVPHPEANQTKVLQPKNPTVIDEKQFIFDKFLVKMPPDFYSFWDYCATVKPDNPSEAFANFGLHLVGPYDVCAGKFSGQVEKSPEEYLIHWRYFYDPPEFQTVIKGPEATGYHIGYFRDEPSELPVFVGCNHARKDGEFTIMGDNIFAAVYNFLENASKSCDPFKKMTLTSVISKIKAKAAILQLSLAQNSNSVNARNKKVLSKTFNGAGLIVPYDRKTQLGYRHLYISNKDLRQLLDRVATASDQQRTKMLSELQPVLTAASIATDECDFGTGLELGWNMLAHGIDSLNTTIEQYLTTAYNLLNRQAFAKIASAHMANRRKGTNLSIL